MSPEISIKCEFKIYEKIHFLSRLECQKSVKNQKCIFLYYKLFKYIPENRFLSNDHLKYFQYYRIDLEKLKKMTLGVFRTLKSKFDRWTPKLGKTNCPKNAIFVNRNSFYTRK